MTRKLYLIDGSNHAFRSFFAMPRLSTGTIPTGALLGYANLLQALIRDEKPDFLAVAFDEGPSFRVDLLPSYKGHRPDMPRELREQWPLFRELTEAWGIRYLVKDGYEADDIIGTLARAFAGRETDVVIVSSDKDFAQLVGSHVKLLEIKKGKRILKGPLQVEQQFGVSPSRVVDLLALWGDSSDNVPGIPGVGAKKAAALIKQFGDLDAILANARRVKGKMGENLRKHADDARLARQLVTIATDLDMGLGLEDLAWRGPDKARLSKVLTELRFTSHLRTLGLAGSQAVSAVERDRYRTIKDLAELRKVIDSCGTGGRFAFDTETTSLDPLKAELVGLSLCWSDAPQDAVYLPIAHKEGPCLHRGEVLRLLAPLLEDPAVGKVGQNLKFDMEIMGMAGIQLNGVVSDTMIADHLLEPNRDRHGLDDLALRHLGHRMISYEQALDGLGNGADFSMVPVDRATRYAAEDAHIAWLLDGLLSPRLEAVGMSGLFRDVELPVLPVLAHMELAGIKLDPDALRSVAGDLDQRIQAVEGEIFQMAGHVFNVNSPKQLAVVLFDERGLMVQRKTKTGRSTDARTLDALSAVDPLPALVLDYRSLTKLRGTYVESLIDCINPVDRRVHTSFHQAVAATGRLASNSPNLQNIPVRTEEGRRIRSCFVPEPGYRFLSADYSQIELRVLADYCGEGPLVQAFQEGEDIHRRTAAEVFGVAPGLVSAAQRRAAKAVNFGIIYGMSAFRLSSDLGIPRRKAAEIIQDYFLRYPRVKAYIDGAIRLARDTGHAVTRFGRKRPVPNLDARLRHEREAAERIAINTPIQGTAADIMKIAMAKVFNRLRAQHPETRILLQVHDELLLEVPENDMEQVRAKVVEEMVSAVELVVPLKVDTGEGANWDEAH